jgi:hypothetical protein
MKAKGRKGDFTAEKEPFQRTTTLRIPLLEFVNLLRSPGIDSQPGGSGRQPYMTYIPARQATEAGGIDSLESISGLPKRLQIRAPRSWPPLMQYFMYRRPTLYPLEIAVDFLKSL